MWAAGFGDGHLPTGPAAGPSPPLGPIAGRSRDGGDWGGGAGGWATDTGDWAAAERAEWRGDVGGDWRGDAGGDWIQEMLQVCRRRRRRCRRRGPLRRRTRRRLRRRGWLCGGRPWWGPAVESGAERCVCGGRWLAVRVIWEASAAAVGRDF